MAANVTTAATADNATLQNSSRQVDAEACPVSINYSGELFSGRDEQEVALFAAAAALAALTFVAYAIAASFIARRHGHWTKRGDSLMTLSIYPVLSVVTMVAVLLPTSAVLCDAIITAYSCVVLWNFKHSTMKFFGGKRKMMQELAGRSFSMRTAPFTCCCVCLPPRPVSKKLLVIIRLTIVQFLIVRPTLGALSSILWADDLYDTGSVSLSGSFIYINVINIASTLATLFAFGLLRNAVSEHLSLTLASVKFRLLQAVLVLTNIQHIIFTALATAGVIGCSRHLPAKARANELYHVALNCELFIVAVAAVMVYLKAYGNEWQMYNEQKDDQELNNSPSLAGARWSKPGEGNSHLKATSPTSSINNGARLTS